MEQSTSAATIVAQDLSAIALGPQLSRANIFGFFVTLQICQLTQPHGSLLFRGVSGALWRTNPVSSFIEACIILRHLARPTRDLCMTLPSSLISSWLKAREDGLWKGLRSFSMPWREYLCDPACALLLLRGAMSHNADGELMQKLMDDSFELQQARAGTMPVAQSTSSHSGLPRVAAANGSGQGREDSSPESAAAAVNTEPQTSTRAQPVTLRHPGLQRRWTELELGHLPRPESNASVVSVSPDIQGERAKLLHSAFGSNALAHGEKQIDIVTTAATVLILLKLLIIHQAPWFTTYALLIIFGWGAVQSLLLLFHSREMSDVDMVASVRQARLINEDLLKTEHIWKGMYLVMHMPILGYVSYLVAFRFHMPNGLHWLGTLILCFWLFFSGMFAIYGGMAVTIGGGIGAIVYLLKFFVSVLVCIAERDMASLDDVIEALVKGVGCAISSFLSVWVLLGFLTYLTKWEAMLNPDKFGPFEPVFGRNSTLNFLVDEGFHHAMLGLLLLIVLGCLSLGFWNVFLDDDLRHAAGSEYQYLISGGNSLSTIAVFTWYLVTYNAEGTYKPAW